MLKLQHTAASIDRPLFRRGLSFIYPGNADYRGLLAYEDLTAAIQPYLEQVPGKVAEFKKLLQGEMPLLGTGGHCEDPYECPFWSFCSQG